MCAAQASTNPPRTGDEMFDLSGRVAIVTGASSGLGAQFVRALVAGGATVVGAARRMDRLQSVADETGMIPVACDVSDPQACVDLVAAAYAHAGRIDILVNNAGFGGHMRAEEQSVESFKAMLDVDLVAPFLLSQQVVVQSPTPPERMSIINIASIHGVVASGRVSSASYTASKAGIINMTRELAVQWARKGVRVNAIAPGWFQTEATAEMFGNEKPATWLRRQTPMGRTGEIHELDGALRFLASDASSFMTGQVIVVDGGWTSV